MQVVETSHQVGRTSVSTPNDMPYMEMAGHCEALRMGKQQKLSTFMAVQHRQENSTSYSSHDSDLGKEIVPSTAPLGFPMVLTSSNILTSKFSIYYSHFLFFLSET